MKPLLIEIGTEELPVAALPGLAQALFDGVVDGLVKRGVEIDRDGARPLYSPRRLAVLLPGVAAEQPEQRVAPELGLVACLEQLKQLLMGFLGSRAGIGRSWCRLLSGCARGWCKCREANGCDKLRLHL